MPRTPTAQRTSDAAGPSGYPTTKGTSDEDEEEEDMGMAPVHPHRCRPPRRAMRGTVYECWCRRHWVAYDSITVRDGRIWALRPDWRTRDAAA